MTRIGDNGGPPIRDGNWIAISRDVIEHHIVGAGQPVPAADKNRGAFSRLEAWLDLLCMANFKERQFDVRGITITLKPGETLAGRAHLSERWNWSEKTVRNFLEKLEREMMISLAVASLKASENQLAQVSTRSQPGQKTGQLSGRFPNVLSVCNWTKYQLEPMAHEPVKGPVEGQLGASWGPYLNKETNNNIISPLPPKGDEKASATQDLDKLSERLLGACNGALDNPVNCQGLASLATPLMWMREGCDLEADILPTLHGYGKSAHGKRVRSWDYFSNGIRKARDRRLAGLPVDPNPQGSRSRPVEAESTSIDEFKNQTREILEKINRGEL